MVLEKIVYFNHEYLWNKDTDQPVEKYVHMSMVIGASRLGTIFTNYTVYGSSVAPAVARSPSLSTILISISRMWVWVYVRWELLFAVVGVRVASVPMILLFSLLLSLDRHIRLYSGYNAIDYTANGVWMSRIECSCYFISTFICCFVLTLTFGGWVLMYELHSTYRTIIH